MTAQEIIDRARRLATTNSTTYTDSDALADLNTVYGLRILDILRLQVDRNSSQTEQTRNLISTTGLVAGDAGYNGEYPFPTDFLKPVRFEISYDGTTWRKAEIYDLNDTIVSEFTQSELNAEFTQTNPMVRFDRSSFFIRPLPTTTVTAGIHIWYEQRQATLTTSSVPDIEPNYHELLAFDLAELFGTMYPEKMNDDQWKRVRTLRNARETSFKEFYKNQFLRNLVLRPVSEDFGTGGSGNGINRYFKP